MKGGNFLGTLIPIAIFIVLMYVFLIRPQKKKEKEIQSMRDNVGTGDEIITIGGIKGKIVKARDESLVIQVGADKTKFEITRWAVSKVVSSKSGSAEKDPVAEKAPKKKSAPKRLKKAVKEEVKQPEAEESQDTSETPAE